MSNSQPPKLNYVKARQKSKTKNEPESQQKIYFQADSSTDIFAHLNQDNLNYIKKELKSKKSHHPETNKTVPLVKVQQKSQTQINAQTMIHQRKVYEKYKNSDQVTQRDSRQQETLRQTSVDESMLSEYDSTNSKNLLPLSKLNNQIQPNQKEKESKEEKQMNKLFGLEPLPLTYKKQSLTSNQGQNMKHIEKSLQFHAIKTREMKENAFHKNPFQEYELKSEASNNPISNSTVSVQNHFSQDMSANIRPSQFMDRLQNYIEELNFTPQKISKMEKTHNYGSVSVSGNEQQSRNFRKIITCQNNENSINEQVFQSQKYNLSKEYGPGPVFIKKVPLRKNFHHNEEAQAQNLLQNKNVDTFFPKKNTIKNCKYPLKTFFIQVQPPYQSSQILQNQFNKERSYCMKLALELEKYKENEQKYRKQIILLNKSIEVLKIQIFNIKQIYEKEVEKANKIISYIKYENSHKQKTRNEVESDVSRLNQSQIRNQPSANNYSSFRYEDLYRNKKENHKEFQKMMKFSPTDQLYADLNPHILNNLNKQFKKGQHLYHQQNTQRYPLMDVNFPYQSIKSLPKEDIFIKGSFQPHKLTRNAYKHNDHYEQQNNHYERQNNHYERQNDHDERKNMDKKSLHKFGFLGNNLNQSPRRANSFRRYRESEQIDTERNSIEKSRKKVNRQHKLIVSPEQVPQRKQNTSLEKLKQEYEQFKAHIQFSRPQHKKIKSQNIGYELSPREFSHVYVK